MHALRIAIVLIVVAGCKPAPPDPDAVAIVGRLPGGRDVSGVGLVGDYLVLVSDETSQAEIFRREGERYVHARSVMLDRTAKELDLEAVAVEGDMVYVIGSHSPKRPQRDRVYRFRLDADGMPGEVERSSLSPLLDRDPVLKSHRNAIDIEGLAVREGRLYVGCRTPVVRGRGTPVIECDFADPEKAYRLHWLDLDGRGVRDLAVVKDGFLVLAGPAGDEGKGFRLYLWDGRQTAKRLDKVAKLGAGKPEGIAVLAETAEGYELLVVYDGLVNGGARRVKVAK